MADFTIYLSDLIASGYDVVGEALMDYPAPSESVRKELNALLITHYADREIGSESPSMFCFRLKRAMAEIMPYYNQTYIANAKLAEFDPSKTYSEIVQTIRDSTGNSTDTNNDKHTDDYTHASTGKSSSTGTSTTNTESSSQGETSNSSSGSGDTKNFDVPITGSTNGFSDTYATSGQHTSNSDSGSGKSSDSGTSNTTAESSTSATSEANDTNKGTHVSEGTRKRDEQAHGQENTERSGYTNSIWQSVEEYRKVIENWKMKIIANAKVDQCFMGIFDGKCDMYGCGYGCWGGGFYGY